LANQEQAMYASDEEDTLDDRQRWSPATQDLLGKNESAASARARWIAGPFVRLLATNMAFGFSISCFYLLPKYLTVSYAATPGTIGAVMGIFGLTCVLIVPWLGRAVNALGLVRTLCLSQILMAASSLAFAFLGGIGPAMLFLRTMQGLATAGVMTAGVAMVCALSPANKLGQAMGLAGAASLIMNAIAPAVAEPIGARYGFPWVFAMSGLAALVGFGFARKLPVQARVLGAMPALTIPRRARPVLLSLAMCGAGFNVVMAFLAPLALSRGAAAVRGFFAAYTLAALAVRVLGSAWTDRIGPRRTAMLGTILYGATIAAVAGVGPRSMVALGLVFGLAHGALFPALMAQLFYDTMPAERAKLAALSNGVMNLGMLTVLGFGQLANHFGLVSVFLTTGTLVAASALLREEVSSS
jgi:MFS family permease